MEEDLQSCDRDHPPRPGRCPVGQHQWVDRFEDGKKKVVCSVPKSIKTSDIRPAYGHQPRARGCGPHKNHRQDKKARRREDRNSIKEQ